MNPPAFRKPDATSPFYRGPTLKDFSDDYNTLSNRTRTQAAYVFDTLKFGPHWQLGPQVQVSLAHGPGVGAAVVVWGVCWSFIGFVL